MEDETIDGVHRHSEIKPLPLHSMALDREGGSFGLSNFNRFDGIAQSRLICCVVAARLGWHGDCAVIFQMRHPTFCQVNVRDKALHGTGVTVVRLIFPNKGDGSMRAVSFRD